MDEDREQDEPIHISSEQARGAGDADEGSRGATLVPMLVIGLVLVILGVTIILMVVR
jgi:hypothetical protein